MRIPARDPNWPESWQRSFEADRLEVLNERPKNGYSIAYNRRREIALNAIHRFVPPGSSLLDVAAAQGNFSIALAEAGYNVTWNDLREELIPYVESKLDGANLEFLPGSVFEIEPTRLFDAVLATEIIEHVAHPDRFLQQMAGLCAPGGVVVVTTPNGSYWRNSLPRFSDCDDPSQYEVSQFKPDADGHIFLLHPDEVGRIAETSGLELVELMLFTNSLSNGHVKLGHLLPLLPTKLVSRIERQTSGSDGPWRRRLNVQMLAILRIPTLSVP